MIEIRELLAKFQNLLLSEKIKEEAVRQAVAETLSITLEPKDIKIKNNTIYLDIRPVYKNEIFMKKEKVLERIKEILGPKSPRDIR